MEIGSPGSHVADSQRAPFPEDELDEAPPTTGFMKVPRFWPIADVWCLDPRWYKIWRQNPLCSGPVLLAGWSKKTINTSWFQPTPRCICLNNYDLGAGNLINISMIIEVQLKISKLSQCLGNRGNTSSPLPFLAPWIQSLCTTGRHCGSLRPNKTSANGAKMKSTNCP